MKVKDLMALLGKIDGNKEVCVELENDFYADNSIKIEVKTDESRLTLVGKC